MRRLRYLAFTVVAVVACGTDESLLLTRDEWQRVTIPPYHALYDDYAAAMPAKLAVPTTLRDHFAGDPSLTLDQAVTRWALPTLAPAKIGEGSDAVLVVVDRRRRAIVGLGEIVRRRVAALDATCATAFDRMETDGGTCIETLWFVADAALRAHHGRFAHACSLALNACR